MEILSKGTKCWKKDVLGGKEVVLAIVYFAASKP
jgi:hypothetical protein